MRFLPAVMLLLLVFSCADKRATTDGTPDASTREVEQLLQRYYADMSARRWDAYRAYFWDSATITTTWQQPGDSAARVDITSIDAFIRETPQGPDSQPIFEETMKASRITVKGNLADAWVEYDARFGRPDSLTEWSGTDVFTLLKHDGEWRIVSLVFESN